MIIQGEDADRFCIILEGGVNIYLEHPVRKCHQLKDLLIDESSRSTPEVTFAEINDKKFLTSHFERVMTK